MGGEVESAGNPKGVGGVLRKASWEPGSASAGKPSATITKNDAESGQNF